MRTDRFALGVALASALAGMLACGGGESAPRTVRTGPAPNPNASAIAALPPAAPIEDPDMGADASAGQADAGHPLSAAEQPLPPPKPMTIALSSGAAGPTDDALVAGDAAFEAGDLATAAKRYATARKLSPKLAGPMVGAARVAIARASAPMDYAAAKGNHAVMAAASELRSAVKLEPTFGPAYVELGRALLLLGDAAGAIDTLRKGAQMLPDNAEAHSALGVALLATGSGDESLTELSRAVELDRGSAARHGNEGTVLFMRGRVPDAIREYELQVRLADGDARAHSDLGTALLAHNEIPRAESELRRAIALDPSRSAFHSNLGYALQIEGKVPDAIAEYRAALAIDPKSASAWINLATALSKEPSTRKDARDALEKARAIDPTDPRVKANLEELDAVEHGTVAP